MNKTVINESQKTIINPTIENNNSTLINDSQIFNNKSTQLNNSRQEFSVKFVQGQIIGNRFKVISKIFSSGEADLYKILSLENNAEFVFKIYRRLDSVKPEVLQLIASIDNKNIGQIQEYGKLDGFTYIIMPFYKNGSLASYLKHTKFDKRFIRLIIRSAVEGLNAIHKSGVLHKDLKPANMMLSDDSSHIILIDFGISSITNGQTVVATQTGKTPFYSAPETNAGLFLEESDYYSLGITIYELITGSTPYQNTSIEDLQKYQQIQQIPFPKGFDKDLKDLITALTYKDISYRNDKSNPNRRWGYEEVIKWLNGEDQLIPGETYGQNIHANIVTELLNIPYVFKGQKYYELDKLIESFLVNWNDGKKEVFRFNLAKYFEQTEQLDKFKIANDVALLAEENSHNHDALFFDLMYELFPNVNKFYAKGYSFASVFEYGEKLIDETLNSNSQNRDLLMTAQDEIFLSCLKKYAIISRENVDLNKKIIDNLLISLRKDPLDLIRNALRVGNALTGKQNFIIGNKPFKSAEEFSSYLLNLYNHDFSEYVKFCKNNRSDINHCKVMLIGDDKETFEANLIENRTSIQIGTSNTYYFRNVSECVSYIDSLWNDNQLDDFYDFKENCFSDLEQLIKNSHPKAFSTFEKRANSCFKIADRVFKDVVDFESFYKQLSAQDKDNYLKAHENEIVAKTKNDSQLKQYLEKNCKIYQTSSLDDVSLGQTISFGHFNNRSLKWIVVKKTKHYYFVVADAPLFRDVYSSHKFSLWIFSHLRNYLNDTFLQQAFTPREQMHILNTSRSLFLKDRLFILTITEVRKYLSKYCDNSSFFWAHISFGIRPLFFILLTLIMNVIRICAFPIVFMTLSFGLGSLLLYLAKLVFKVDSLFSWLLFIVLVVGGVLLIGGGLFGLKRYIFLDLLVVFCLFVINYLIYIYRYLLGVTKVNAQGEVLPYEKSYNLSEDSGFTKSFRGVGDVSQEDLTSYSNVRPGMYLKRNCKL